MRGTGHIILLTILVVLVPLLSQAGAVDLPKTGQTTVYSTGDDGDIQAGVSWPSPRFMDNGDGTITDNLTGLMWLQDANCIATEYPGFDTSGTFGDGAVSWPIALDFVADINNVGGDTKNRARSRRNQCRLHN